MTDRPSTNKNKGMASEAARAERCSAPLNGPVSSGYETLNMILSASILIRCGSLGRGIALWRSASNH